MGHQPEQSNYIAEWTKAEAEAAAAQSARIRSFMKRFVAPLAVVAAAGGVAWAAKDWTSTTPREPATGALALSSDGPSTTGSLQAKEPRRTESGEAKPDTSVVLAQAQAGKPPAVHAEPTRAWVDPDPAPAAPVAALEPEPVEPVVDGAPALPPARPGEAVLKPHREVRPKPASRPAIAEAEEASKPRLPEKQARIVKPAPAVAEVEDAPAPPRKARSAKPAKPVLAKAEEESGNRQLRRRSLAAANLREDQAAAVPPRLEVRRAQKIEVLDVEVNESGEHVVRGRGKPVWVVEGEKNEARPRSSAFPSEFVSALRHYNTRYSMQTSLDE